MPLGAGLFPAGLHPGGYGQPETAPFSPNAPLPDPATGLSQTGRFIDQKTGDYVMQADGRLQGMPTVAQLVLIAIKSIDVSDLAEKGQNFEARLRQKVANALANLIAQRLIQVRGVTTLSQGDAGIAAVDWVDLTTGAPNQTPIGSSGVNGQ